MTDNAAGPCAICGRTNYAMSYGGPSICPQCDCGSYNANILASYNQRLTEKLSELSKERKAISDLIDKLQKESDAFSIETTPWDYEIGWEDSRRQFITEVSSIIKEKESAFPIEIQVVEWRDPASATISDPIIHRCSRETAIKIIKELHPERQWNDEDALEQFLIINFAIVK